MAKVKLAIRIRPFTDKELKSDIDRTAVVCVSGVKTVTITNIKVNTSGAGDSRERVRPYYADFTFDSSCHKTNDEYATQEKVFETIGEGVLASMSQGLSACVLAYGQSATGKTYTMMGTESNPGLIPRLCRALGDEQPVDINVSFLEIYNERVHDLLAGDVIPAVDTFGSLPRRKGNARKDLRVREHPIKGPYVQNLRRVCVRDVGVLLSLVCEGARRRRTAATRRNPASSRSHALLQLTTPRATLHLADLAGSEKASWEGCGGGRQKEGANINKSLVALSNVISALVNGGSGRSKFVPYRDSALTWLLKDCFTGGGSIFIIATVSPSYACYGESASTLRWAAQARRLQTPKPAPVAGVTTRIALQSQLNQLLSELSRHHIRYIPESGKIRYDDDHWKLNTNINNDKLKKGAKIGNIMNTTHPKTDAPNSESTNSLAVSESSDVMYNLDNKTKVDNEIHKEVDKFFGPMLERTQSGSVLDITPLRHKKRQYCSEEVLPVDESLNDKNNEKLPDFSQNHNETKKEEIKLATEHKNSPVSILYENQRAEIIASVTERLYSKFKKDAAANKMDATGDKKTMPPLSELKICSNARQRLLELSQKAIRNKKRIGIPAHTQTRRVVIRVKDQGINAQTDLAPFIILKDDTKIFYKDAATETIPLTPRCKDVASGDGSLNFDDKSTTMEIIKIAKKHSNVMTDIILKRNMCTQTQILPHSRRRKRASACTKLHKNRKSSKQTKDSCIIPSVININISPVCSFDADSLNSSEKSDNECTQNKSENLTAAPDLLASYNTDIIEEVKVDTELTNAEKACSVKDEIISTSEVFHNIILEDFPDEDLPLPRVTVDTTRVYDDNDIKNLILGRDVNAYPYNIALSPNKNKDVKRVIKFKDSKSGNFTAYNEYDKTNFKKDNRNHLLDPYSDTSDSTRFESESFVWNKGNIRDISTHKNQPNYDIKDGKIFNHCFDSETELELDINTSSVSEKNNISKKGKYWTWQSGNKSNRLMKERDAKYKDNFRNIQNKIIETCSGLENAASEYERYLNRYYGDHPNKSPTEYLHYLVNLRREVVRESLSTCSTDTISSDGHDASTL